MDDTPAPRKTLSLKGVVRPIVQVAPPPQAKEVWKCKPCGARLGALEAFLSGEEAPKVRARKAVLPPPAPAPPPPAPEIKARPKIVRPT